MRKILATLAIMFLAACGSAAQTGPKTSNPPLPKEQEPEPAAAKSPVEIDGLKITVNALEFQLTMSASDWGGRLDQQADGNLRLIFMRKDTGAVLVITPVNLENSTAEAIAEGERQGVEKDGITASALVDEGHGRWAFTADPAAGTPDATKAYLGVVPHPTIKDVYLIFVAFSDPGAADAFLAEVRTIADSVGPIQ